MKPPTQITAGRDLLEDAIKRHRPRTKIFERSQIGALVFMIAAVSLATGFVANGVPAQRSAAPVIHMNEAAAKAAWLAKQDMPSWGPGAGAAKPSGAMMGTSAMAGSRVVDRGPVSTYDDHSQPLNRLGASGIASARMPLDALKEKPAIFDDHTYPMGRLANSGIPSARMPLDTPKNEGPEDKVY